MSSPVSRSRDNFSSSCSTSCSSDDGSSRSSPAAARGLSVNTTPSPCSASSVNSSSSDPDHSDASGAGGGGIVGGTRARQRRFMPSEGEHWTLDVSRTPLLPPSSTYSPLGEGLTWRSATNTPQVHPASSASFSAAAVAASSMRFTSHLTPHPQSHPQQLPLHHLPHHLPKEERVSAGLKCLSIATIVATMLVVLFLLCLFVGVPQHEVPPHVPQQHLPVTPRPALELSAAVPTQPIVAATDAPSETTPPVAAVSIPKASAAPDSAPAPEPVARPSSTPLVASAPPAPPPASASATPGAAAAAPLTSESEPVASVSSPPQGDATPSVQPVEAVAAADPLAPNAASGAAIAPAATLVSASDPAPSPSSLSIAAKEADPSAAVAVAAVQRTSFQPSSPAVESEKKETTASAPAVTANEPQDQQPPATQEEHAKQSAQEKATDSTLAESPPPQQTKQQEHAQPPSQEKKTTDGTPEQILVAKYLNLSVDFVASMERKHECLIPVPPDSPVPRLLYQLAYDFDQALNEHFEEHKVWYTMADGTLLGFERHKGMLPWDDDVDVVTECPGPGAPCWTQWYDPQSVLRKSLRRRNLEVFEMHADSVRHMLKVYSTDPARYVALHEGTQTSFPSIDVFVHRRLRCNVSDHASDISRGVGRVENTDPHDAALRAKLQLYETEVLAYLTRPMTVDTDPLTGVQTGPCSVQTHDLPNMLFVNEVFPRKRVMFGPVEMWAPAKGAQIVRRWIGHSWAHSFSRTFMSHHPPLPDAEQARLRAEGKPVPDFTQPWTNPGSAFAGKGHCRIDIFDLLAQRDKHPEDRALADEIKWIARPAVIAPDAVVRESSGELASKRLMDDPVLRALATEEPKAPEDVSPWTQKYPVVYPLRVLPKPNKTLF